MAVSCHMYVALKIIMVFCNGFNKIRFEMKCNLLLKDIKLLFKEASEISEQRNMNFIFKANKNFFAKKIDCDTVV